jgi:ACR3 family arsenite efflux pump ArsB
MDLIEIIKTIVFTIFIPMILGVLTRVLIIKIQSEDRYTKNWVPHFSEFSTLGVLSIVFIAIALKAASLIANPSMLIQILVPLILLYGVNYAISTFVARKFLDRGDGIALVYGTVMRNLSIALAIAMNSFGPQAALILALSYIVQVQSGAWYVKISDKFFGKA